MKEPQRLTRREQEVVGLVLQGKSNKLIGLALGISDRTVEFHLKNIYAKLQVSSRIELIVVYLGATPAGIEGPPGSSTVETSQQIAENRDRFDVWMHRAASIIGKEFDMKTFLHSTRQKIGMGTALAVGALWLAFLSSQLNPAQIRFFIIPLALAWLCIGGWVGWLGERRDQSLVKVILSTLLAVGMAPLTIIPLMWVAVLPLGYLAAEWGWIDPATMPGDVASNLAAWIMITLWLLVGAILGWIAMGDMQKSALPATEVV